MRPLALLAALLVAAPVAAAQSVLSDPGTPHVPQGFITPLAFPWLLNGARVTATWDGGATVREYAWDYQPPFEGSYGVYEAAELMLLGWWEGPDALLLQLWNFRATPLERVVIDGVPGQVVFDRALGGADGTLGSGPGLDAVLVGAGPAGTTVTYRNAVQLVGHAPAGDLFTTVDLWLGAAGLATSGGPSPDVALRLDADVARTVPVSSVPEPGAAALLAAGLLGLAGAARQRGALRNTRRCEPGAGRVYVRSTTRSSPTTA